MDSATIPSGTDRPWPVLSRTASVVAAKGFCPTVWRTASRAALSRPTATSAHAGAGAAGSPTTPTTTAASVRRLSIHRARASRAGRPRRPPRPAGRSRRPAHGSGPLPAPRRTPRRRGSGGPWDDGNESARRPGPGVGQPDLAWRPTRGSGVRQRKAPVADSVLGPTDASRAWAGSGMMSLTGPADGPALGGPAALVDGAQRMADDIERSSTHLGRPVSVFSPWR